jgi:hypothetical protein
MGTEGEKGGGHDGWDMNLTIHLHLMLGLRMTVIVSAHPPYAIMGCTGTTLHVYNFLANDLTSSLQIHIKKGKGKVHPRTGHEGPGGGRGIALFFL